MAKKRYYLPQSVVEAARERIINTFDNGVKVYLAISGGKDSIVLCDLVYQLAKQGRIDTGQLTVLFIDEEAMYDDVIDIAKKWRKKFISVGARFDWYCVEVKHHSCFNSLTQDESFICWDSTKSDVWCRPMPAFAITDHPRLRRRKNTYQDFLERACDDGIRITGVRVSESVQRLSSFRMRHEPGSPHRRFMQAIFDWSDTDVWRYIRDHDLEFPETYMRLYQTGRNRREMRISQFFSIDTARTLVQMSEFDPSLMERVSAREPNAYLASLYWDTEMFRSAGGAGEARHHEKLEKGVETDYKSMTLKEIVRLRASPISAEYQLGRHISRMMMKFGTVVTNKDWKDAYAICVGGDPKARSTRALGAKLAIRLKEQE